MQTRKFDEMISYFNRKVSDMYIDRKYKMELLAMITAIGMAHEKELDAQLEQRWIPCSERLPKNNCQCIVTAKVKHVDGYPDYEVDTADYTDGIFTTANDCWWGIESIIAWMPLPEGYRGEQDE